MPLDLICLAFTALMLLLGILSGFLKQIVRILALVGAFLLASPVSRHVAPLVSRWIEGNPPAVDLVSLVLAWIGSYILLALGGGLLVRILRGASQGVRTLDRFTGGLLGALKGVLVVYLAVSVLLLFRQPVGETLPGLRQTLRESRVAAFVDEHNLLGEIGLPNVDRIGELTTALSDPEAVKDLLDDPAIRDLQNSKAFRRLMRDAELKRALAERNLRAVLENPSFRQAWADAHFRGILSRIDYEKLGRALTH